MAQQEDPTPFDLTFTWYEACTDHDNAVSTMDPQPIRWTLLDGALHLTRVDQHALGTVSLYATVGRLLARRSTTSSTLMLPVGGTVLGVHLVNVMDLHGHSFTQRFFIP